MYFRRRAGPPDLTLERPRNFFVFLHVETGLGHEIKSDPHKSYTKPITLEGQMWRSDSIP